MPYSICCGAYTNMTEIGLCPECLEHCEFEDYIDPSDDQLFNNQFTEGGVSFRPKNEENGR